MLNTMSQPQGKASMCEKTKQTSVDGPCWEPGMTRHFACTQLTMKSCHQPWASILLLSISQVNSHSWAAPHCSSLHSRLCDNPASASLSGIRTRADSSGRIPPSPRLVQCSYPKHQGPQCTFLSKSPQLRVQWPHTK